MRRWCCPVRRATRPSSPTCARQLPSDLEVFDVGGSADLLDARGVVRALRPAHHRRYRSDAPRGGGRHARGRRVRPLDPARYAPRGAPHRIVRVDLWCAPCNRIRQPPLRCLGHTPDCLAGVTVPAVVSAGDALAPRDGGDAAMNGRAIRVERGGRIRGRRSRRSGRRRHRRASRSRCQRLDQDAAPRQRRRTPPARSLHLPRRLALVVRGVVPAQGSAWSMHGGGRRWRSTPSAPRRSRPQSARARRRHPRATPAAGRGAARMRVLPPADARGASERWTTAGQGPLLHVGRAGLAVDAPRPVAGGPRAAAERWRSCTPHSGGALHRAPAATPQSTKAKRATSARCSTRSSDEPGARPVRLVGVGPTPELPRAALVASAAAAARRRAADAPDRAGRGARRRARRSTGSRRCGAARARDRHVR